MPKSTKKNQDPLFLSKARIGSGWAVYSKKSPVKCRK